MLEGQFTELFYAGLTVSAIGCFIKTLKILVNNCRQIECMGFTVYNSTLYENLVNRVASNSTSSTNNLIRQNNPMISAPLLGV